MMYPVCPAEELTASADEPFFSNVNVAEPLVGSTR
jgi:hypothetical protein